MAEAEAKLEEAKKAEASVKATAGALPAEGYLDALPAEGAAAAAAAPSAGRASK